MRWLPDRKWFAEGLTGLIAFALLHLFPLFGMNISEADVLGIVGTVMLAVHYFVPPSLQDKVKRLDADIKAIVEERANDETGGV